MQTTLLFQGCFCQKDRRMRRVCILHAVSHKTLLPHIGCFEIVMKICSMIADLTWRCMYLSFLIQRLTKGKEEVQRNFAHICMHDKESFYRISLFIPFFNMN